MRKSTRGQVKYRKALADALVTHRVRPCFANLVQMHRSCLHTECISRRSTTKRGFSLRFKRSGAGNSHWFQFNPLFNHYANDVFIFCSSVLLGLVSYTVKTDTESALSKTIFFSVEKFFSMNHLKYGLRRKTVTASFCLTIRNMTRMQLFPIRTCFTIVSTAWTLLLFPLFSRGPLQGCC